MNMNSDYTGSFVKLLRSGKSKISGFKISFISKEYRLNKFISIPAGSFLIRVTGDSMINAGISNGDYLLVESTTVDIINKIIIAEMNGKITLKRLINIDDKYYLKPENPKYDLLEIKDMQNLKIWGIATKVIKDVTDRIG
jgi:DNA polymerase V